MLHLLLHACEDVHSWWLMVVSASLAQSLEVLKAAKECGVYTKSSIMLGLGKQAWQYIFCLPAVHLRAPHRFHCISAQLELQKDCTVFLSSNIAVLTLRL